MDLFFVVADFGKADKTIQKFFFFFFCSLKEKRGHGMRPKKNKGQPTVSKLMGQQIGLHMGIAKVPYSEGCFLLARFTGPFQHSLYFSIDI